MTSKLSEELSWEDFDHTLTRDLAPPKKAERGTVTTKIFYEKRTFTPHVVQFCRKRYVSKESLQLVDLARTSKSFIKTHFTFSWGDTLYIGSQVADMCLADIVHCSLKMTEAHAAAILNQVSSSNRTQNFVSLSCRKVALGLVQLAASGLKYNGIKASNVFISRDGLVQLSKF